MGKKFETTSQLDVPVKQAKVVVEKALEQAGFSGIRFIENTEIFLAETSVSLWSWSENIMVKLIPNDSGTSVEFKSQCALATQVIDWGKNRKNAEKFVKYLN